MGLPVTLNNDVTDVLVSPIKASQKATAMEISGVSSKIPIFSSKNFLFKSSYLSLNSVRNAFNVSSSSGCGLQNNTATSLCLANESKTYFILSRNNGVLNNNHVILVL